MQPYKNSFFGQLLRIPFLLIVRLAGLHNPRKTIRNFKLVTNRSKTRLLIACMPKSGSTYSSRLLERLTGFQALELSFAYGRNEQEIYWPRLVLATGRNTLFVQQHIRCSRTTVNAIAAMNLTTIVQTRNIFDIVVSLRDHLAGGEFEGSMAYVDERFLALSHEQQIEFIIDMMVPWYLNFFVSWVEAAHLYNLQIFWLRYEDLTNNPRRVLEELSRSTNNPNWEKSIDDALNNTKQDNTRLNIGITGRGKDALNSLQQSKIQRLTNYYPNIDFTPIGLGPRTES